MARGTQHRKRRTPANARVAATPAKAAKPRRPKHERWEDQLFFARLRVHAKWMFLFLALVFGLGFVIFGVGSGSTGISDVLQNFFTGSSSGGRSLSSLRKQAREHPKQAKAWRDLATKLEAEDELDEATEALKRYTALRPKDESALQELASVYLRRATEEQQVYLANQTRIAVLAPSRPQPSATSPLGKALSSLPDPIATAVGAVAGGGSSEAYAKIVGFQREAVGVYEQLARLNPKDATTQFRLAQVAQGAGDVETAVAAYRRFIALAPDDPLAATAKKALEQLKPSK
ncbi:MAG TPA: tetratricopeptide repeat protein [Gaiellaceae bacterium]|nr:tetratricopeptide repeat protein [Gaiellaceae bacterium]